jgi:hypothetical protein
MFVRLGLRRRLGLWKQRFTSRHPPTTWIQLSEPIDPVCLKLTRPAKLGPQLLRVGRHKGRQCYRLSTSATNQRSQHSLVTEDSGGGDPRETAHAPSHERSTAVPAVPASLAITWRRISPPTPERVAQDASTTRAQTRTSVRPGRPGARRRGLIAAASPPRPRRSAGSAHSPCRSCRTVCGARETRCR